MRYLFLLLLASVFCPPGGGAQTQAALDHLIGQLDLANDLQTGYLLNKAGSTGTLEYDGPRMVDVIEYSTTHDLLARMHVSGPAAPFVAPEVLEAAINNANTPGTPLPVSILLHEYERIKPDAIANGLLQVQNGQLYDETGPDESPYEQRTIFLMSVLEPARRELGVSYHLDPGLIFGNLSTEISLLEIDLDDGNGFQNIASNSVLPVSYPAAGNKIIRMRATTPQGVFETMAQTDLEPAENFGIVPIVMAAYRLNYFDPDAVANNMVSVTNNQLVDISGPNASPYLKARTATVAHFA